MALLAAPGVFLFAPLIQFFPVGLGSDHIVISCVFTVLLFGLLLPIFGFYRLKKLLSYLFLGLALVFFIVAHTQSSFSEIRQKPNSLSYYNNLDTKKAYWVSYDKMLDPGQSIIWGEIQNPHQRILRVRQEANTTQVIALLQRRRLWPFQNLN